MSGDRGPRRGRDEPVTPRLVAVQVLESVERDDAFANLLLPSRLARSELSRRDRGFATELTYGTIRNRAWYDEVLGHVSKRPIDQLDPTVRAIARLAAHQWLTLDTPAHAVVNESITLARQSGVGRASGFLNASLRALTRRSPESWDRLLRASLSQEDYLRIRTSHPAWIVRALQRALADDGRADELARLLAADKANPPVQFAVLPPRTRDGLGLEPTRFSPIGLEARHEYPADLIGDGVRVQDQGSQLAALCLAEAAPAAAGERWLDACAGPGGKTAVLASAALLAGASLEANEPVPARARLVARALAEGGFAGAGIPIHERDGVELMRERRGWDRILVDAPCSGLGALRRRPEARWRKQPGDLPGLTALQRDLLDAAIDALAPGGVVAYVTCSPHLSETRRQVEAALEAHPEAEELDTRGVIGRVAPGIPLGDAPHGVQLWPHAHDSDAMFVCLLRRRVDAT